MLRAYLAIFAVAASLVAVAPRAAYAAGSCAITAYPLLGHYAASKALRGPGLWLDGGSAFDGPAAALQWVHDTISGHKMQRFGNLVVLRAGRKLDDRALYKEGDFASVRELLIPACANASQIAKAERYVNGADVVLFSGDGQPQFIDGKWKPLVAAVKRVYARGGVVGGGSAGASIQGAVVYHAVASGSSGWGILSGDAIADPLKARIALTSGPFTWPALHGTIIDPYFARRDRFGRMVAFLALIRDRHLLPGQAPVYGLGIDEGSAVMVGGNGMATVYSQNGGLGAYLVRASGMPTLTSGEPLRYDVTLVHLALSGERFDLLRKRADEAWFPIEVNGKTHPPYVQGIYQQ